MRSTRDAFPAPVIRRLIKYRRHLAALGMNGQKWVLSRQLAATFELTDVTVRQDISYLRFAGKPKRGYHVVGLGRAIGKTLGSTTPNATAIVGARDLGSALALYEDLPKCGFPVCGVFDVLPGLVGQRVGQFVVRDMRELPSAARATCFDIGVLAVRASVARTAAFELISAGVRGLLNLTHTHLVVPWHVTVVDVGVVDGLQELACAMRRPSSSRLRS